MIHEIPSIRTQPLRVRELRDARGRFRVPARLTESIGEIGSFNVGRRTFVVVNSGELTRITLTDHVDAFAPLSGAADCAWRLLSNGALIKAGQFDRAYSRAGRRAFAAALHAQLDAAAPFAERLWAKRKVGDDIDLDQELLRLTRWIGVRRLLDVEELPDIAEEIAAALTDYGSTSSGPTANHSSAESAQASRVRRISIRKLRRALARAAASGRTAHASRADGLLAPLASAAAAGGQQDGGVALSIELTSALLLSLESMRSVMRTIWRRLAEQPEVRMRLQRELDGTLKGRTPQHRDLRRLPYTLNVIRETLRLDPPVVMFSRRLARDIELGDYRVRAGSIIVFNTRRVHRCASLFPSPDVFRPDRFDAVEGKAARAALGDLPLGDPTRSAGDRYVWSLTHLVLATIAQRISLVPSGTSHTVSAVRSQRPEARASDVRIQRRGRRWSHPVAVPRRLAPVRFEARHPEEVQTTTENAAIAGGPNLILTCEALRAAV